MASPTTAHQNSASELKVAPPLVVNRVVVDKPPKTRRLTIAMAPTESTPVAISPL